MTWRGWAASTGHTVKELIAIESKEPGLSNMAFAALTHMYNLGLRLYAPCLADPNYIQLVQSSSPPTALATLSSIIRGPARTMGHFNLILHKHDDAALLKRDDAALLDAPPPLALLPAQSPARETSKIHDVRQRANTGTHAYGAQSTPPVAVHQRRRFARADFGNAHYDRLRKPGAPQQVGS